MGVLACVLCLTACGPAASTAASPSSSSDAPATDTSTESAPTSTDSAPPAPPITLSPAPVVGTTPPPAVSLACGCGHDSFGDPYITDAQGAAIHPGMSDTSAFAALGGKAVSGPNGDQQPPPYGYMYPVKGTGNPDDVMDTKTIWWDICVGFGRVTNTYRGHMDDFPGMCPDPGH